MHNEVKYEFNIQHQSFNRRTIDTDSVSIYLRRRRESTDINHYHIAFYNVTPYCVTANMMFHIAIPGIRETRMLTLRHIYMDTGAVHTHNMVASKLHISKRGTYIHQQCNFMYVASIRIHRGEVPQHNFRTLTRKFICIVITRNYNVF